ncbi:hypothetical protein CW751_08875 [Brumimicrobium salinarum]|uniref:Uncharacterized protein n=1 Tax=Brumimicrobium salinarum TaxID=2058658 RepID=A0A2I0R259_9FLAO|nr:hypothetical protein [Brumimicrobium salinarum]PKR80480.1 hypothetical protein CW751_08875 [Brumimicrobium salinarum]
MKIIYFALTLSVLALFSCKKKELEFNLTGYVSSSISNQGLSNVNVEVYTIEIGKNIESLKGTTQTDGAGKYSINIDRSKFEKLIIVFTKENYFKHSKTYFFDDLTADEENVTNPTLEAKSFTRFIIKNQPPNNDQDVLKIQKVNGKTDCSECCPDGESFYTGKVDTIFKCANTGDTYMKFYWWVNGSESYGYDSVLNVPFETTDYILEY